MPARGRVSLAAGAAAAACLGVALAGCIRFGRSPDPPEALRRYLDALVAQDLRTAYDVTQLDEVEQPGAALSFEHFRAFYRSEPLRGYTVKRSTKLGRVSIEEPAAPGTPFYDVDVELRFASGTRTDNFAVEGEVLGTVTVDPAPLPVRTPGLRPGSILLDGVPLQLPRVPLRGTPSFMLLVLPGRHALEIEGIAPIRVQTSPLGVEEGPARVAGDPPAVVVGTP